MDGIVKWFKELLFNKKNMLTIQIKDLEDFIEQVSELQMKKTFNTWVKKSMIFLEWEAIKETPVDKWFLWNSYEVILKNLQWILINTRAYWVPVHEWHNQTPWRFVPAIWKRLKASYVKWNPFLTRTARKSNDQVNKIFNKEIVKTLNSLKS